MKSRWNDQYEVVTPAEAYEVLLFLDRVSRAHRLQQSPFDGMFGFVVGKVSITDYHHKIGLVVEFMH